VKLKKNQIFYKRYQNENKKKRGSNLKQKINKREINILTLKDEIENKFNLTKALNKKKTIIKE
jgi:hypothetical protein